MPIKVPVSVLPPWGKQSQYQRVTWRGRGGGGKSRGRGGKQWWKQQRLVSFWSKSLNKEVKVEEEEEEDEGEATAKRWRGGSGEAAARFRERRRKRMRSAEEVMSSEEEEEVKASAYAMDILGYGWSPDQYKRVVFEIPASAYA